MEIQDVVILRVETYVVNNRIVLFDKIYMFREEFEPRIPEVFASSLVITKPAKLLETISAAPGEFKLRHAKGMHREKRVPLDIAAYNGKSHAPLLGRIAVVPMLLGRRVVSSPDRESNGQMTFPRYLRAEPKMSNRSGRSPTKKKRRDTIIATENSASDKLAEVLAEGAYLLVNGVKVEPVCQACVWNLFSIVGACKLGDYTCVRSIAFPSAKSAFYKNILDYEAYIRRIPETEDC